MQLPSESDYEKGFALGHDDRVSNKEKRIFSDPSSKYAEGYKDGYSSRSEYEKGFDLGYDDGINNKDKKSFPDPSSEYAKGYDDGYLRGRDDASSSVLQTH